MGHFRIGVGALAIGALATASCIVDGSRCDAHQVELHGNFAICVCEPDAVFNASGAGCTPCGENETALNGACTCKEGFARPAADAGCVASTVGAACSAATPCSSTEYPFCVTTTAGDGYCSREGCASNADCPTDYTCEAGASARYCKRPLTGLGAACTSSADCAGFEASYCEAFQTHTCILQGCANGAASCPNEWACCDFSSLLGAPFSICASPSTLTGGSCPNGGTRVTP